MLMTTPAQELSQYAPWVNAMSRALDEGDGDGFHAALAAFGQSRDADVTQQVRRVATELRGALERFRIDSKLIDLAQHQVPDARHRLAHVLRLTDDAAHRTMDLVEQCCPLADQLAQQAERLILAHDAEGSAPAPKPQMLAFLKQAGTSMAAVRSNLAEVLLTQGYQDLSGQIIRGVMTLVAELEEALGELVRIAGPVGDASGCSDEAGTARGHGPVVPGINHGRAVSGQKDVDALLSDLGV
jgi:chemotaxis protein CheZ